MRYRRTTGAHLTQTMQLAVKVLALAVVTAAEGPCDILGAAGNPCVGKPFPER